MKLKKINAKKYNDCIVFKVNEEDYFLSFHVYGCIPWIYLDIVKKEYYIFSKNYRKNKPHYILLDRIYWNNYYNYWQLDNRNYLFIKKMDRFNLSNKWYKLGNKRLIQYAKNSLFGRN